MNQSMAWATAPTSAGSDDCTLSCTCTEAGGHIAIENLSVSYGSQKVVEDFSLHIPRNAVTALLGPSGCGKSSVLIGLNRLCDLIPGCCVTGSVSFSWLDNERLRGDLIQLRRQVGMLFQRPNPFPFSIWRNLEFALKQHGLKAKVEIADRIEAALKEVGLWDEVSDRLNDSALALSGGQQQRLCLARALVLDPSVILMDEPCSALDPISTQKIEQLVLRLAEKRTIVLVTHSLGQAQRVADHMALLWKLEGVGKLVERGTARQMFDSPKHQLTQTYLQFAA
ncbi:phosphate ABC transporter ATP-binding protein [Roseateles sp. LKC17W]|uniref:Phosphate ABC transporter ATP-binding protein n=1 Tax=Pelomonas margarita TaxID=3299031 RepID=A0ABW7FDL0_9BURK